MDAAAPARHDPASNPAAAPRRRRADDAARHADDGAVSSRSRRANPDCLLFYRMGDFYELFFEDAEVAARALGIVLTKRGKHLGQRHPDVRRAGRTAPTNTCTA